jgi:hypothetical protein
MAQKEGEVTYLRTGDGNLTNVVADAGVLHVQWVTAQMDSSDWQEMPKEPSFLYFSEDMWAAELPTQKHVLLYQMRMKRRGNTNPTAFIKIGGGLMTKTPVDEVTNIWIVSQIKVSSHTFANRFANREFKFANFLKTHPFCSQVFPKGRKFQINAYLCEGGPGKPQIGHIRTFDSFKLLVKAGGDVSAWIPLLDKQLLKEYREEHSKKKKRGVADAAISQSPEKQDDEDDCVLVREVLEWNAKSIEEKVRIMNEWVDHELKEIEYEREMDFSEEERSKWLSWEPKWVSLVKFTNLVRESRIQFREFSNLHSAE